MQHFVLVAVLITFFMWFIALVSGLLYYANQTVKALRDGMRAMHHMEGAVDHYTAYMKALQGKDVK